MPPERRLRIFDIGLWAVLALVGYWSPWLTHPVAPLQLNGFELSEWVTYLPGARDGSLTVGRVAFLAPLACLALLLGIAATPAVSPHPNSFFWPRLPATPLGWILLALALLCCAALFPAYPYILTAYKDPEFRFQFFLACALPFGLLLTLYLPAELNALIQIPLALLGAGYGAWTFLTVRPIFSELLNASWTIGLGWFVMLAGFVGLAWAGVRRVFSPRQ
jgi:hypothetical protein